MSNPNAPSDADRAVLREALLNAYVVEAGLPPEMGELLDMLSQPAPRRRRRMLSLRLP